MLPKSHVHRSRKQARKQVLEVGHHLKDKVWSGRHGCLVGEDLKAAYGSCSGYKQLTHTPCHHTCAPAVPLSTHRNNSANTRGIFLQVLFHPFQFQELSPHVESLGFFSQLVMLSGFLLHSLMMFLPWGYLDVEHHKNSPSKARWSCSPPPHGGLASSVSGSI